jgi:hypothetical protein
VNQGEILEPHVSLLRHGKVTALGHRRGHVPKPLQYSYTGFHPKLEWSREPCIFL